MRDRVRPTEQWNNVKCEPLARHEAEAVRGERKRFATAGQPLTGRRLDIAYQVVVVVVDTCNVKTRRLSGDLKTLNNDMDAKARSYEG